MSHQPTLNRRRFLRETFAFSALAFAGLQRLSSAAQAVDTSGRHMLLVGDWGADKSVVQQNSVADSMRKYTSANQLKHDALLMIGDNFYGQFEGGVQSPRWKSQFEDTYPRSSFDCPCYAVLGNHDYIVEPEDKTQAQLEYAKQPGTRWVMPAKWYRFEFPRENPLVTFIALDSNYQKAATNKKSLTEEERAAQLKWLKAELAKPRSTKFLIVWGHHPLFSNGPHGDSDILIKTWDPILREHKAHFYFCGHDHDLQHLEFEGHPTSFVVSGGGGASLTDMKKTEQERGPFGQRLAGFSHLQFLPEKIVIRHIDAGGKVVHAFSKTPEGKVTII